MDRTRAVRLAIKCIEHLETYEDRADGTILSDPNSATFIGIKGAQVVFSPMKVNYLLSQSFSLVDYIFSLPSKTKSNIKNQRIGIIC